MAIVCRVDDAGEVRGGGRSVGAIEDGEGAILGGGREGTAIDGNNGLNWWCPDPIDELHLGTGSRSAGAIQQVSGDVEFVVQAAAGEHRTAGEADHHSPGET